MISEQAIHGEIEALVARTPNAALIGIGIDIETNRSVDPDAARFFLTDGEREWLKGVCGDTSPQTLLRLWTVKEAILKADPENTGKMLGDYTLENPSQWTGNAYPQDRTFLRFRYSSVQVDQGFLSIAILAKGERDA
jgi:phosphopantetheinyl transferase